MIQRARLAENLPSVIMHTPRCMIYIRAMQPFWRGTRTTTIDGFFWNHFIPQWIRTALMNINPSQAPTATFKITVKLTFVCLYFCRPDVYIFSVTVVFIPVPLYPFVLFVHFIWISLFFTLFYILASLFSQFLWILCIVVYFICISQVFALFYILAPLFFCGPLVLFFRIFKPFNGLFTQPDEDRRFGRKFVLSF